MCWMLGIGQAFRIWIRHNEMGRFGLAYERHSMFAFCFRKSMYLFTTNRRLLSSSVQHASIETLRRQIEILYNKTIIWGKSSIVKGHYIQAILPVSIIHNSFSSNQQKCSPNCSSASRICHSGSLSVRLTSTAHGFFEAWPLAFCSKAR